MKVMGQDSPGIIISGRYWWDSVRLIYLFHGSYSIHLVNLGPEALDFDADISALFDHLLAVISPLRRRCVCVKGDI
jgi:hypothetical protein